MERREILKKLEEEVSVIKDQELKKIAFEKLLNQEFGEQIEKGGRKKKKTKQGDKRKPKTKSSTSTFFSIEQVRDDIKKLNITGKIKNLVLYKLCKKRWEKCLWVLAAVKKFNVDGLNNHEIAYILNKRLYTTIKYSTVNNIRKIVSEGLVMFDPEEKVWKITPDGEEHLKNVGSEQPKKTNKK